MTAATSFVTPILRYSLAVTEQKCVSRHGGHAQLGGTLARYLAAILAPQNRILVAFPSGAHRATELNRRATVELLWQPVLVIA